MLASACLNRRASEPVPAAVEQPVRGGFSSIRHAEIRPEICPSPVNNADAPLLTHPFLLDPGKFPFLSHGPGGMRGFSLQQQGLPPDGGCGMRQDLRTFLGTGCKCRCDIMVILPFLSAWPYHLLSPPGASAKVALGLWAESVWPHSNPSGSQLGQRSWDVPAGATVPWLTPRTTV